MAAGWRSFDGAHLGIWSVAHDEEVSTLNPGLLGNRTETRDATARSVRHASAPTAGW